MKIGTPKKFIKILTNKFIHKPKSKNALVPWTDRITNEEILRSMGKDREIVLSIKRRKQSILVP